MICAQTFCVIKRYQNDYKILNRINVRDVCFCKRITFITVEKERIIREIQKNKDDFRSFISFLDRTHISNKFIESNKRAIK